MRGGQRTAGSVGAAVALALWAAGAGATTIAQNSSWTVTRPGATQTFRVVAYGDSIFAGYINVLSVCRRAAPHVAGEYCAAATGQNWEIIRRCQSGATASQIYLNRLTTATDRAFMQTPNTRIVTFEMCGNDYLQARSNFRSSTGTCSYAGLTAALNNCKQYTQLAMQYINAQAHPNTKLKVVMNLYYPGFDADNAYSSCTDPVNGDPANGFRVHMRTLFLPLLAESNWWTCHYAEQHGFECADAFAAYMARDYDSNGDGQIDSDAIRYRKGESLESYRSRILALSGTLRDSNFKMVNATTTYDYLLSDDTHPTYEGPTGFSGTTGVFFATAGPYPDGKNPAWNRNGHDRAGWALSPSCQLDAPRCGNGTLDTEWLPSGTPNPEGCDDGNTADGDGCSAACQVETGWSCSGAPSLCAPVCGDGLAVGLEQCDDGNTAAGDGCSPTCTVEPGYSCIIGNPWTCVPVCGDGLVVGAEGCDDGNLANDDGCSSACTVEEGWTCAGEPSACSPVCGDGLVRGTEACDDGTANGTPQSCCTAGCAPQPEGTACDDGNLCTDDVCDGAAQCVSTPRSCDDGNVCTDDSCDPATGCVHVPNTAPCDDGDECTAPDVCAGGVCQSGPPVYSFDGFFPPVDNPPVFNVGKAGRTYPVKWKLPLCAGGEVTRLDAVVYNPPRYRPINCDGTGGGDPLPADDAGASGLRYDTGSGQYIFNWKTSKSFENGCYELLLEFDNGITANALFKFTK